jgi:hypothetical protein
VDDDCFQNETQNDRFFEHLIDRGVLADPGTFFECGATDGVGGSSTYALEIRHGWTGVLAEALHGAVDVITRRRPRSTVVPCAVTDEDGRVVEFVEADRVGTSLSYYSGVRSALEATSARARLEGWTKDQWRAESALTYLVPTITLNTIFEQYLVGRAPTVCCLDMEGSELAALAALDLHRYRPAVFTIEDRQCNELLEQNGYHRIFNPFNRTMLWEEYFVEQTVFHAHRQLFELRTD